jgi:hypothetical protein
LTTLFSSVDWWGFDWYGFTNRSWLAPIEAYARNVFPRLHSHQRVVHVTTAFADGTTMTAPEVAPDEGVGFCRPLYSI